MKNHDELTSDLLERRDRYVADQKRKRKTAMSIATSFCCVCLVALLGFGMLQGGMFSTTPPIIGGEQTLGGDNSNPNPNESTGLNDNKQNQNGQVSITNNNEIVINSIEGISADKMNIALMCNDRIEMSIEELCEYYGVNYVPDVPADIKLWPNQSGEIFRRNGGTGEVYWDGNGLNFSNEDFTRSVHVGVDKGSYVLQDYLYFKGTEEKSVINDIEVVIGLTENGYYYSEFMYNGVGFFIDAEGVTEEEFVAIITSIIK